MKAFFKTRNPRQQPASVIEPLIEMPKKDPSRCTVLVTGGTEGIGSVICRKMKDMGYIVAATYSDEDQARAWQDKMEREGYFFFIYPCKLESFAESQRLVKEVARDLGAIDILVNAAGLTFKRGQELDSAFNVTCSAMENMLDGGFGRIINVSFMNMLQKSGAAEEDGLHKLTQKLAPEVMKKGITVNTISPGEHKEQASAGGFTKPEDVADVVSFLASGESGFITGVNIPANGGETEGGIFDERF